jgi:hypothetical protein
MKSIFKLSQKEKNEEIKFYNSIINFLTNEGKTKNKKNKKIKIKIRRWL